MDIEKSVSTTLLEVCQSEYLAKERGLGGGMRSGRRGALKWVTGGGYDHKYVIHLHENIMKPSNVCY